MADIIYNRTIFKKFFEKNDIKIQAWAQNVLDKICSPGILPVFFNKQNEDFVSFWGSVTHLFAIVVLYGRQYEEIDVNKILFDIFIKERGLVTDTVDTTEQMQYLFNNYVEEYRKRGRMDIVSKEGTILGELLRLIRYNDLNEFIFALLAPKDSGWTLGHSSPTWNRTDTVENITKAYECSSNIENLDKYPLINPSGVILQADVDNDNEPIQTMTFIGNELVGISSEGDLDKLLVVDEDLAYQVSLRLKTDNIQNMNLTFGVQVYDELKRPVSCIESIGTVQSNSFVKNDASVTLNNADIYYELRATISKKNRSFVDEVALNFPNGRGLRFVEGIKYMSLHLVQDRTKASSNLNIYDIKIKPIYLPFYQGYLGEKNIIASYYRNNSYSSTSTIDQFIETYLVSYKNIFASEEIKALTKTTVRFKVFSERKEYIKGATITIADQELQTDINGEVTLDLYPGDYLYSVEKDLFISIVNNVLYVEEEIEGDEQICYIQMQGELYKRKVTFVVKNEQAKAISGAIVKFNNEVKSTGQDGSTFFMAYPDLYLYTVEKEKYYPIDKSVLVRDDMIENVTMQLIPIFDVTFIVKDSSSNPIQGARINFNNTYIDTNEQGQAVFKDVLVGTFNYRIEKIDWLPVTGSVTVTNAPVTQNITMNPVPTYNVTFTTRGVNYQGVVSLLTGVSVTFAGSTKISDSSGQVSFIVKAGSYSLTATKAGYNDYKNTISVDEDSDIEIRMSQKVYVVTFIVQDDNNKKLSGVSIQVENNPIITTNTQGQATINLPDGSFNYTATLNEYHTITDLFGVNGGPETVNITMSQKMYQVTATVREEGQISVGATVTLGSYSGESDSQGKVSTELPNGSYNWTAKKTIYASQQGQFVVNSAPYVFDINLVRRNGQVTFMVVDDLGKPVEAATVVCNNITRITNSQGKAEYTLPIGSYDYEVSKRPEYTSVPGEVSITDTPQTINVLLTNKTYNINFTVTNTNGNAVPNATIVLDGDTKTTDTSGKVTFPDKRNGLYNWTIQAVGYYDKEGTVQVSNNDANQQVSLTYSLREFTVTTLIDGSNASGVNISYTVYESADSNVVVSSGNGSSDYQGKYVINAPYSAYVLLKVEESGCLPITTRRIAINTTGLVVALYKALILRMSSQRLPSFGSSVDYEWSGNELKIVGGSRTNPSTLNFNCQNNTSVLAVTQWPGYFPISGTSVFNGCTSLSSLASGSPNISGSIESWFRNCTVLRSIPSGLLLNVSGSDASNCFRGSGITSVPLDLFGSNLTLFASVFRDCSSLSSVSGSPFRNGTDFESAFNGCSSLSSVGSSIFPRNAESFYYTFANSGISSIPSGLFDSCVYATTFEGLVSSCTNLRSIPARCFRNCTRATNFNVLAHSCTLLSSIGSDCFPTSASSFSWSFIDCKSLTDISGCKIENGNVTTWARAFEGSGVQRIPPRFFAGQSRLVSVASCFKNCTNLTEWAPDGGAESSHGTFNGCTSLQNMSEFLNGCIRVGDSTYNSLQVIVISQNIASTVTNWNYAFLNCSELQSMPIIAESKPITLGWLWDLAPSSASHYQTFKGCSKISYSNLIPSGWK